MAKIFDIDFRKGSLIDSVSKTTGTLAIGNGGFRETEKGKALLFDGANTRMDTTLMTSELNLTGNISICGWLNPKTLGESSAGEILDNGKLLLRFPLANKLQLLSNGSTATAVSADNSIQLNTYSYFVITRTSAGITNFYINNVQSGSSDSISGIPEAGIINVLVGNNNGSSRTFDGHIGGIKIYNTILNTIERTQCYEEFLHSSSLAYQKVNPDLLVNEVSLYEDFRYDNADGSNLTPLDWNTGTGNYKIGELPSQDSVLKDLAVGTKYLESTSAGTIAIQQNEAYGTWEFDIYKGADGNTTYYNFLQDRIGAVTDGLGYQIRLSNTEETELRKTTAGGHETLFESAASYIAINTWYRLKITRSLIGVLTVYIKGGSFGNIYTLVSTTGGTGSNPVTDNTYITSKYFVGDLDVGDRITNIKKLKGIEV